MRHFQIIINNKLRGKSEHREELESERGHVGVLADRQAFPWHPSRSTRRQAFYDTSYTRLIRIFYHIPLQLNVFIYCNLSNLLFTCIGFGLFHMHVCRQNLLYALIEGSFWRRIYRPSSICRGRHPARSPATTLLTPTGRLALTWLSAWKMLKLPVHSEFTAIFRSRCLHFLYTVPPRIFKFIGRGVPNNAIAYR